jgi:hypothetical protein
MSLQRVLFLVVSYIACITFSCRSTEHNQKAEKKEVQVQAQSELFRINGITATVDPDKSNEYLKQLQSKLGAPKQTVRLAGAPGGPVPYTDFIIFGHISCLVGLNQFCREEHDLTAPVGYQACKPLFGTPRQNGGDFTFQFSPKDWYLNESEFPPRFRTYHFFMLVRGSARVYLPDVGIRVIPALANNFNRYATGCEIPTN